MTWAAGVSQAAWLPFRISAASYKLELKIHARSFIGLVGLGGVYSQHSRFHSRA